MLWRQPEIKADETFACADSRARRKAGSVPGCATRACERAADVGKARVCPIELMRCDEKAGAVDAAPVGTNERFDECSIRT